MAISLELLTSRRIRHELGFVTKIKSGLQIVKDSEGNVISKVYSVIEKFGQSLMKFAMQKMLGPLVSIAWDLFVRSITFIVNFNWNISDAELDQQVDQGWAALSGQLGGTLGNAAGHLICGIAPGVFMFRLNVPLALKMIKEAGEEFLDEFGANLNMLIRSLIATSSRAVFSYLFKKIRKSLFPDKTGNHEPWSFAIGWDNYLDSIDDNRVRQYTEESVEEGWEACTQAGYILANVIDGHYAQLKMDKEVLLGNDKIVEIEFSRDSSS